MTVWRDQQTYLYDRNMTDAPICYASGPYVQELAEQQGDVLGREWGKVRSKPQLNNCVVKKENNDCGDF